jgi:hypothetical protein
MELTQATELIADAGLCRAPVVAALFDRVEHPRWPGVGRSDSRSCSTSRSWRCPNAPVGAEVATWDETFEAVAKGIGIALLSRGNAGRLPTSGRPAPQTDGDEAYADWRREPAETVPNPWPLQ